MTRTYHEERLGRLLSLLRPVPRGWVQSARELPLLRQRLDELVTRAEADRAFRQALLADLEAALEEAGVEPTPRALAQLRERLPDVT